MAAQRFGEFKHVPISPVLRAYLVNGSSPVDPVVAGLVEATAEIGELAVMQVPEEQAGLLTLLSRLVNARTVLDVGTFTGLSALALARGLAPGGTVITCDVTDAWLPLAEEHWEKAGVRERIDARVCPAEQVIRELPAGAGLDLVFLDADKESYLGYYHLLAPRLRPGGLLLVDNVLFNGFVLDPALAAEGIMRSASTALREFNAVLAADPAFEVVMLPIADGLTIACKK